MTVVEEEQRAIWREKRRYAKKFSRADINIKDAVSARKRHYNMSCEERLYYGARKRAAKIGVPFTIKVTDIVIPLVCPCLGTRLDTSYSSTPWVDKDVDKIPSLDRIVPNLGYVPGNVVVMSMKANTIKSYGTAEEHEMIARFIRSTSPIRLTQLEDIL